MSQNTEEMLSAEAARKALGISRATLQRLLASQELRGLKVGGQWRFRRADLETYLERTPQNVAATALPELDAEAKWWKSQAQKEGRSLPESEAQTAEDKVVAIANAILVLALGRGASDMHLEPTRDGLSLRFRSDGVLSTARVMPLSLASALVGRFKAMSAMKVEETLPQDGRVLLTHAGQKFDLRCCTLPALHGEALTIRVLPSGLAPVDLERLEMAPTGLDMVKSWLGAPQGLIMVVGLAGSGKTTTLFSLVHSLAQGPNRGKIKILSVEDPIEMAVEGVTQVNVRRAVGLDFAPVLRAFLRHDPDVVVASEIQDAPSAQLLVQAALSGHLTLAGWAAPTATEAISRLIDMGIEPFLLAASLQGVVAQCLARRVCPDCAETYAPDAALVARARDLSGEQGLIWPENARWQRGAGCAKCRGTGFRGRVPLYEILAVEGEVESAVTRRVTGEEIAILAREAGFRELFSDGVQKALDGRTTLEEVFRALALPPTN